LPRFRGLSGLRFLVVAPSFKENKEKEMTGFGVLIFTPVVIGLTGTVNRHGA